MPNFVQLYNSTDTNAPVLTGQVGTMNALLQAVLVDGYTTASVTSITESGTTYTVTFAGANNTLRTGNYITISGCTGGWVALNGIWQITVSSSTVVTFVGPGGLGTPATGTILYRKAPLQWTNAFATASNVATFRAASVTGRTFQPYLRVDDNGTNATPSYRECQVRGYSTMSDKDTGTEAFPTTAQIAAPGVVWRKSTSLDATARPWTLIGDGATFYLVVNSDNSLTSGRHLVGFGGFNSYKSGDAYNAFCAGVFTSNNANPSVANAGMGVGVYPNAAPNLTHHAVRSHTQTGTSVGICTIVPYGPITNTVIGGTAGNSAPYPHPVDGGLWVTPLLVQETTGAVRGRLCGMYSHLHSSLPCADGDRVTVVAGLSGVTLYCVSINAASTQGQVLFDEFGPW